MDWSLDGLKPYQWKDRWGKVLDIRKMDDDHIVNTIRVLERKYGSAVQMRSPIITRLPITKRYRFLKRELRRRAAAVSDSVSEVNKEEVWHE